MLAPMSARAVMAWPSLFCARCFGWFKSLGVPPTANESLITVLELTLNYQTLANDKRISIPLRIRYDRSAATTEPHGRVISVGTDLSISAPQDLRSSVTIY